MRTWLQLIVIKWTWLDAGGWKGSMHQHTKQKHGSCCLLSWYHLCWHKDEQMRAVSSVSLWRSHWSRCWQRGHLLVNKSIFAKVTICFMPFFLSLSPHLSLSLSCLLSLSALSCPPFTSLALAWVIFMSNACHWLVAGPSARQRKTRIAALSAFSSHQPDCMATGGYVTAVSGQQQVPGPACQQRWAPTPPTGCRWPSACMSPTHTYTSHYASQHSSSLSALPPAQERKLSNYLNWIDILFRQHS